ncbi:ligase [Acinetobacter baumannii]|uniref:O-antigen ligase family protein n=1 Tax=Acinetobacter baumannii TaxID=470 RepID=UPI000BACB448|nr:O-antigen ligase family protein [Acinetobacter baumannii]EKV4682673.1 O-antigen ligase family protein [Acinetobacter baumannii]EKV7986211.1 O-antigen ligase family protein [Acinetobacter baumannii]EKW5931369.1 O-antigen ligase family protein [Acinetobacter baumannii]EKX6547258.1 O-antigen ligase family protein [Acinetobacter baumannii]ELB3493063.1 O-antigen ligase family protein [Acinetobacter baumannii]
MIVNGNKVFGIQAFIISSLIVIFIVSIPALAILRVPLLLAHISLFYFCVFLFRKRIHIERISFGVAVLLFYVLVQNLMLQEDWIVIAQAVTMVTLVFFTTQIAQSLGENFYESGQYKKLSKFLFFLLPFFCVSFMSWTESRQAGLFMNPNITGHLSVMLLPFILLGLRKKKFIVLAMVIALLVAIITASRSTLMALLLSCAGYVFVSMFPRIKFLIVFLLILTTTLVSMYAVDFAVWLLKDVLNLVDKYDSRFLYLGYNGRDILMEQALERFSHQPVLGLGFDGAKFEIDGHALGTHNGLLDLLLRLGYAGTALFAVFSIVIVKIASALKPPFKAVSIMALIAIFSLSTNSSTFFVFNYLFLYVLILICAGKKARISVSQ